MNEKEKALLDALIALGPPKHSKVVTREAYIKSIGAVCEFLHFQRKGFDLGEVRDRLNEAFK